jgi:hypothetical protein
MRELGVGRENGGRGLLIVCDTLAGDAAGGGSGLARFINTSGDSAARAYFRLEPLVAVLSRDGQVVWQAQGITDWAAVEAASRSLMERS